MKSFRLGKLTACAIGVSFSLYGIGFAYMTYFPFMREWNTGLYALLLVAAVGFAGDGIWILLKERHFSALCSSLLLSFVVVFLPMLQAAVYVEIASGRINKFDLAMILPLYWPPLSAGFLWLAIDHLRRKTKSPKGPGSCCERTGVK